MSKKLSKKRARKFVRLSTVAQNVAEAEAGLLKLYDEVALDEKHEDAVAYAHFMLGMLREGVERLIT